MSDKEELKKEISDHWPELERKLGPMGWREVRKTLVEFTGADVKGTDLIKNSCHIFTESLQRMRAGNEAAGQPAGHVVGRQGSPEKAEQ